MIESRMNYEMEIRKLNSKVQALELYIATLATLVNNINLNQMRNTPPVVSPGFIPAQPYIPGYPVTC